MKALVHKLAGEVTQIVADDATFEVHGDLVWKEFDTTAVSYDAAVDNPPEFEYNTETEEITRKVFDDFEKKVTQTQNEKLIAVRKIFDKYNLISGLHTYCAQNDKIYKNILPPLSLLNRNDEEELINRLKDLEFYNKSTLAA